MIDSSSSIRVHQHAANAQKKHDGSGCMGRSRGGLTTKIHALVDANGLPIALKLTEGQAHDARSAAMEHRRRHRRPKARSLLADRAYDTDALRQTASPPAAPGPT